MSWNHKIINNKTIILLSIPLISCLIGCSTYFVPKESKVVVPKDKLSSYNPKIFATKNSQKDIKSKLKNEDQLIIKAIFLENQGAYKQSNTFYALLYKATNNGEYLLKEVRTAHLAKITSPYLTDFKAYVDKNPNNLYAQRLLLSFYLQEKKLDKAKEVGEKLTQHSKEAVDFELAANPYIFAGEYEESLKYLQQAYDKTLNEDILLKLVTININYLHKTEDAIELLETHRKKQGCSEKICLQLSEIYIQQQNISKLISIYKALHQSTKKDIYTEKVIESYLLTKDIPSAVEYLENNSDNYALLYALYMEQRSYDKAYELARILSKKTNEPKWYAESAISLYESLPNKDDKAKLNKVINHFEEAFHLGEENPIYFNYYGYTLIEKELNVEKGLEFIKKALSQEPANTYFLDSLAWGYFKLNNCEKAYPAMKKVVEVEGLKEEEIIEHWNAIDSKCK